MTDAVQFARATASASAHEARRLRHEAQTWLAGIQMDDETRGQVVLAVNEAVENVVEHAYPGDTDGTVELILWVERHAVNVQVIDHGRWRDVPEQRDESEEPSRRGRGFVLMHRSVDSVSIRHDAAGTVVALRHNRDLGD